MAKTNWIDLNDYSTKHDVSVSTLRRRIKSNTVEFVFDQGKYFLPDENLPRQSNRLKPTVQDIAPPHKLSPKQGLTKAIEEKGEAINSQVSTNSPLLMNTANELLGELKKAYMQILQEKEEQIMFLKEEISDLKTLTRILEEDNTRLKSNLEF